jgi:hypothetical protein
MAMMKRAKDMLKKYPVLHYFGNHGHKSHNSAICLRLRLLWTSVLLIFFGGLFGVDFIGEALEDLVTVLFEFAQTNLESMFHKFFKLDLRHAQMATAYTGFALIMAAFFVLFRKFSVVFREAYANWNVERQQARELWLKHRENIRLRWNSMDGLDKCFAAIGFIFFAIPLVSILCIALGNVVADLV